MPTSHRTRTALLNLCYKAQYSANWKHCWGGYILCIVCIMEFCVMADILRPFRNNSATARGITRHLGAQGNRIHRGHDHTAVVDALIFPPSSHKLVSGAAALLPHPGYATGDSRFNLLLWNLMWALALWHFTFHISPETAHLIVSPLFWITYLGIATFVMSHWSELCKLNKHKEAEDGWIAALLGFTPEPIWLMNALLASHPRRIPHQ